MKKFFFHIFSFLGGPGGGVTSNPDKRKFQGSKTTSQSRHMYNKGENNHQFFIYGPQYNFVCSFGYSGGPGWPMNNGTGPILLPSYPLTYINLHIKYGSNPIRIFEVMVRTMKCLRTQILTRWRNNDETIVSPMFIRTGDTNIFNFK